MCWRLWGHQHAPCPSQEMIPEAERSLDSAGREGKAAARATAWPERGGWMHGVPTAGGPVAQLSADGKELSRRVLWPGREGEAGCMGCPHGSAWPLQGPPIPDPHRTHTLTSLRGSRGKNTESAYTSFMRFQTQQLLTWGKASLLPVRGLRRPLHYNLLQIPLLLPRKKQTVPYANFSSFILR